MFQSNVQGAQNRNGSSAGIAPLHFQVDIASFDTWVNILHRLSESFLWLVNRHIPVIHTLLCGTLIVAALGCSQHSLRKSEPWAAQAPLGVYWAL